MQDSQTTITKESNGGLFTSATYRLEQTQFIPKSRSEVFFMNERYKHELESQSALLSRMSPMLRAKIAGPRGAPHCVSAKHAVGM